MKYYSFTQDILFDSKNNKWVWSEKPFVEYQQFPISCDPGQIIWIYAICIYGLVQSIFMNDVVPRPLFFKRPATVLKKETVQYSDYIVISHTVMLLTALAYSFCELM